MSHVMGLIRVVSRFCASASGGMLCALLAAGCGTSLYAPAASATISAPYICSAQPEEDHSKCVPPALSKFYWQVICVSPFLSSGQLYQSEGEVRDAIAVIATGEGRFCKILSPSEDVGADIYFGTHEVQKQYTLTYTAVASSATDKPCDYTIPWTASVQKVRDVSCPAGFLQVQEGGYCACPWGGAACPLKTCYEGGVSKADPCNVLTGFMTHDQVDYLAGDGVLSVKRTYSSKSALEASSASLPQESPLGVGWSMRYLARLSYDSQYGRSWLVATRGNGDRLAFDETSPGVFNFGSEISSRVVRVYSGSTPVGYAYVTGEDEREVYDNDGVLQSITSRSGVTQTLSYDSTGHLVSVMDSFGRGISFSWNTDGTRIIAVTLPDSSQIVYAHAGDILTGVTFPDSTSKSYVYDSSVSPYFLTGIVDESSVRSVSWEYSYTGRVYANELAGGVQRYTFDGYGGYTDPLGTSYSYASSNVQSYARYTSVNSKCASCDDAASRAYDAYGNLTSATDFNGNVTTYSYLTSRSLEASRTEAYGTTDERTISTTWHSTFRLPLTITEPARTTTLTYDSSGNLLTRTVQDSATSASRVWSFTYDGYGHVLTANGPRTDVTDTYTYTYNACSTGNGCGQVATAQDPLGHVTTVTSYNSHGQPLTIQDPNGVVTTLTYDGRQRLTSAQVGSETTTYSYWPTGLLKRITQPDGSYIQHSYDNAQRLTGVTDNLGNHAEFVLDAMGNRTATNLYDASNNLRRASSQTFDSLNRLYEAVGSAGTTGVTTTHTYDYQGNLVARAAPLSRNTTQTVDALNRLKVLTDPLAGETHLAYDAQDNLNSVTDPNGFVTTYAHSGFGDVTSVSSPDTGTTTNTYDSGGNLHTSTDARGAVATYAYDALNRVTSIAYSSGSTTDQTLSFTYDSGTYGKGHLTGASDAAQGLSWVYNPQGLVTSRQQTVGSVTLSLGVGYTHGKVTSLTLPSGTSITVGRDSAGRISSLSAGSTSILSSVSYDPDGAVKGWTWGNSTTASRSINQDGLITGIVSGDYKTLAYDNAFRLTGVTDSTVSANSWSYDYDAADRLTSAFSSSIAQGWTYDANGNRLSESGSTASTFNVSSTSNRLASTTGFLSRTYSYDAAGNVLSYGAVSATYNNRGRMSSLTNGSVTASYLYNALGQMVKQSGGPAGTRLYAYDEEGHLVGEYSSTGALIQETVWLGDIPVATMRPSGGGVSVYYVHTDQLNTPRVVTRPSDNAVMWRWDSDPFGTLAANENPSSLGLFQYNLRLPGQICDGVAGLHQNWMRDYSPATGRYVESDPIGLAGGPTTFGYADGAPTFLYDPYGLWVLGDPLPGWVVNGAAGFGDSLSFGLTGLVRGAVGIGSVDKCSASYRYGEYADLAFETGTLGLSAGLKMLAASASRSAVRNAARPLINTFRDANGLTGGYVHHVNPLFGHPGGATAMFPTGGLPAAINSSSANLQWFANQADHLAAHARAALLETSFGRAINPGATSARAARNVSSDCGCDR